MSVFFDDINNEKKSDVNDVLMYIGYPFHDDLVREDNPLWLFRDSVIQCRDIFLCC